MSDKTMQATPPSQLEAEFMSPNTPLREREHWARNEVESLRQRVVDLEGRPVPLSEWQQMEAKLAAAEQRIKELEGECEYDQRNAAMSQSE